MSKKQIRFIVLIIKKREKIILNDLKLLQGEKQYENSTTVNES